VNNLKTFVIQNPVAGTADPHTVRKILTNRLADREFEIHETHPDEHLPDVVHKAIDLGYELFIAVGGDGTASLVASALVNTDIPMAIVPTGTGNVLARELGIPLDIEAAASLVNGNNRERTIDAMWIGDHVSVLAVGIGISSLTMRHTERQAKRRFGLLAYMWVGLEQLSGLRLRPFHLEVDGEKRHVRASEVLITNSSIIGLQPFDLGPDVQPDDGKVEVCIVRARTLWDYLRVAWSLLARVEKQNENFQCMEARREVQIRTVKPLPVQADGEIIGETPLKIKVMPAAVRVLVPEEVKEASSA
jgi:YegS/Rv2252/BmrU family lipid kinase